MRATLMAVAWVLITISPTKAQQNPAHKPDVEGLLVQLRSNDGGDRDRALRAVEI
jgi:hypothetical protein